MWIVKLRLKHGLVFIIIFFIALVVSTGGFMLGKHRQRDADFAAFDAIHPVREKETSYTFISPLLGYSIPADLSASKYAPLSKVVLSVIDKAKRSGDIDNVSVYFRDLNTNHWFGIDPSRAYYPASLLKVPLMIAYLRKADVDPKILDRMLKTEPLPDGQSTEFVAPTSLSIGKTYSITKLIDAMITESDNGAMKSLYAYLLSIDDEVLDDVFDNLGVQRPEADSSTYQISTRTYAWFFRILYNATYVSPEQSEYALKLLSQATFKKGIVAGVPENITVAHKFGEHLFTDGKLVTGVQMHDCGIIYANPNPYLLCIMTQTKSEQASERLIQANSKTIYESVGK